MHDVMMMHTTKMTGKTNKGIFLGVYSHHHPRGIAPRDSQKEEGTPGLQRDRNSGETKDKVEVTKDKPTSNFKWKE